MKHFLLGCGTGRCGTKSLHALLRLQPNTFIQHEAFPLPWIRDIAEARTAIQFMSHWEAGRVGDIGPAWIRYVDLVQQLGGKIICLKRPEDATVQSFLERKRDHATVREDIPLSEYLSLPKFDLGSREENARALWARYYDVAATAEHRFGHVVRVFDMNTALNTEDGQREMLEWAGYIDPELLVGIDAR